MFPVISYLLRFFRKGKGGSAAGFLSSPVNAPAAPEAAAIQVGPLRISREAIDLIIHHEIGDRTYYAKKLSRPNWPGAQSGITIGFGYDLGYNSAEQIAKDWTDLQPSQRVQLIRLAGLKGDTARRMVGSLAHITVPWEVAYKVRDDIRQFDARRLAHTLRTQLFQPLCQLNGWKGRPPLVAWGSESPADLTALGAILPSLSTAGLELTDDGIETLSSRTGLGLQRVKKADPPPGLMPPGGPRGGAVPEVEPDEEGPENTPRDRRAKPLAAPPPRFGRSTAAERRSDRGRTANDAIAEAGAEEFAEAMRLSLSPVVKILAASDSLDDFERQLRARFPALPSRKAASVMEAALIANAANAVLNFPANDN